jgi:CRP-like cAMP-binding protein
MSRIGDKPKIMSLSDVILKKLGRHSKLDAQSKAAIRRLTCQVHELSPGEDFVRHGERPRSAAVVLEGVVARYGALQKGRRQYLSVHFPGEWPDARSLFLKRMDHSVCAMGNATLCAIPHDELLKIFRAHPRVAFAVWRETLIDAAISREAITNVSARDGVTRLAHFFSEIFHRLAAMSLVENGVCDFPFSQSQLGELLGMSLASTNRHLTALRASGALEFLHGRITIRDQAFLAKQGEFDPLYMQDGIQSGH